MPSILATLLILLILVVPRLPAPGRKVVIACAAVPVGFCLFYMIVAPGWMPGTGRRRISAWRILLFLGCTAAIVGGIVGVFLLG